MCVFEMFTRRKQNQHKKGHQEEPTLLYLSLWFRFEESARVVLL
jgi:hypothetical protein